MKLLLITAILAFYASNIIANSPAVPWRHVVTSEDKFFFVMDPGNMDDVSEKGIAYKAKRNGVEKLWEVSGWYAFPGDVFLSQDGKTLVRIISNFYYEQNEATLSNKEVLFFYRKGKLKRTYTVKELIKNLKKGIPISSFNGTQYWVKDSKIAPSDWYSIETHPKDGSGMSTTPDVFQLTTIEGTHYLFDLKNGDLITKGTLKKKEQFQKTKEEDEDPFDD